MTTLVFWRFAGGIQDCVSCASMDDAVTVVDRLLEGGAVAVWTQPLPWERDNRESWQSLGARRAAFA
jgi:hypothetical protein